jgi:hypothetical protein
MVVDGALKISAEEEIYSNTPKKIAGRTFLEFTTVTLSRQGMMLTLCRISSSNSG